MKKSVEHVYDEKEVITAMESNADVEKSDKAIKRPDVNLMVKRWTPKSPSPK